MSYVPPNAYNTRLSGKLANNFWASGEKKLAISKLRRAGCKSYEIGYISGKGTPTSNKQLIDRLL